MILFAWMVLRANVSPMMLKYSEQSLRQKCLWLQPWLWGLLLLHFSHYYKSVTLCLFTSIIFLCLFRNVCMLFVYCVGAQTWYDGRVLRRSVLVTHPQQPQEHPRAARLMLSLLSHPQSYILIEYFVFVRYFKTNKKLVDFIISLFFSIFFFHFKIFK